MPAGRFSLAVLLALTVFAPAARAQDASRTPLPQDLIGNHVGPPDQSDEVFNRWGLRAIYQLVYRRPLLIVSWRADDEKSLEHAVPAALEVGARHGDDLVLLFIERSGKSYTDMLRVACQRRWLCSDALWTCQVPPGIEALPTPSFVLTSMWHVAVLTGDEVSDRKEDLAVALDVVIGERRLGETDLPDEAHAAWRAFADRQWKAALTLQGAADKRRARGQPGDAEAAEALDKQARILDDALMNELQIASAMKTSGAATEGCRRTDALWKLLKDVPEDAPPRRTVESMRQTCRHETLFAELEASEALEAVQEKLCRSGPGAPLAAAFRKVAKEHAGTRGAERALLYAEITGP